MLFLTGTLLCQLSYAQLGKDGIGNITANADVNPTKTNLSANATAGATTIQVTSSAGILPGDLIMIYQAQGAEINTAIDDETWGSISNMQNAGGYEFVEVVSANATSITLKTGLDKGYAFSRTINAVTFPDLVQIIKVPRYESLTVGAGAIISPTAWNGKTGGVTVIEVNGDLTLNGTIDVTGKGFRGGAIEVGVGTNDNVATFHSLVDRDGGLKGESVVGNKAEYTAYGGSYGRGAIGNGGGGGNGHNSAGGGGANAFDMFNTPWSGLGNPDPKYDQYWAVETPFGNATNIGGIAGHKSSGGGRGGYSWSNQNRDPIIGTSLATWGQYGGDTRDNVGGYGGRPLNAAVGKAYLGGGGGAGSHDNDHTQPGGNGGGLVIILSNGKVIGTGTIRANGANGTNDLPGTNNSADAPSGAGGGGSVILKATFGVGGGIKITTNGGIGGSQVFPYEEAEGAAGGGGGGYVAQFNADPASVVAITSAGGATGITTTKQTEISVKFPPNGATLGAEGSNASFPIQPATPICQGETTTLTLSGAVTALTGSNINWYDAKTGGNKLPGAGTPWTSPILTNAVADTFFYSTATNGIDTRFAVIVPIKACAINVTVPPVTYCEGGNATLMATVTGGIDPYTYKWVEVPGSVTLGTASTLPVSPVITTKYRVIAEDQSGLKDSTDVVVTVHPNPIITATGATMCAGQSKDITASGAGAGGTYTWNNGLTPGTPKSVNPAATTTYTVTGKDVNGCTGTATALVTVNLAPVITPSSASICVGGFIDLTASGADSYSWAPSTGLSATSGPTVTASPASTTTYTVIGTTNAGCSNSATVVVTVNSLPVVAVSGPVEMCIGDSATLIGSLATNYSWSPPDGLSSTSGSTVKASPAVTTTYTVTGFSPGCPGNPQKTVTVTINDLPVVSVNNATICADSTAILTASGDPATYTWSPATSLNTTTGAQVVLTPVNTIQYKVIATSAKNCKSEAFSTVTVNPLPVLSVSDKTICSGDTVVLSASGAQNYSWTPATGILVPSGPDVYASPSTTTTYTITGFDANSCKNTATLTVTVAPLVVPIISDSVIICKGESADLTAGGGLYYLWDTGETTESIHVTPEVTTLYNVKISNTQCEATESVKVYVKDPNIMAFYIPNAFSPNNDGINDVFQVVSDAQGVTEFNAMIFNRWGELFYEWDTLSGEWNGILNGTTVQEDVYVYKINVLDECGQKYKREGIVSVVR